MAEKQQLDKQQVFANVLLLFLLMFVITSAINAIKPHLLNWNTTLFASLIPENTDSTKLVNANFEKNDFGSTTYWSDTSIDLQRWYLTQAVNNNDEVRWAEPVDLSILPGDRKGVGIHSIDQADCESNCDTSILQIVSGRPNAVYTLTAEAKRTNGGGGTLYLDFLDKNKNRIEVKTAGGFTQNTWSQSEVSDSAPEQTEYVRVILYSSNTDVGEIFWDNVRLEVR